MARYTGFSIRRGMTINRGNFENDKPEFELHVELDEGDDYEEVRDGAIAEVERALIQISDAA